MSPIPRGSWIGPVLLLGICYALVGVAFAQPSSHLRAWRLAAWTVSGLLYGGHIVYERIRLRQAPARAAFHVALAAAIGAFGLAVAANIHSLFVETTSTHRLLLRLSLAIWPVMTALPAFVVAFGSSGVLGRVVRDREERP